MSTATSVCSNRDRRKINNWPGSSAATLLRFSTSSLRGLQSLPELFSISPHIFTAGALLALIHIVCSSPQATRNKCSVQHRKRPRGEEGEPQPHWQWLLAFTTLSWERAEGSSWGQQLGLSEVLHCSLVQEDGQEDGQCLPLTALNFQGREGCRLWAECLAAESSPHGSFCTGSLSDGTAARGDDA